MPPKRQIEATGRRRSLRTSTAHEGQRSKYVEDDDSGSDTAPAAKRVRAKAVLSDSDGDDYKENDDQTDDVDHDDDDDEHDNVSDRKSWTMKSADKAEKKSPAKQTDTKKGPAKQTDTKKGPAKRGRPAKAKAKPVSDSEHDSDNSAADDSSDARPRVTFTPHKALRGLDGVEYADTTVHPNSLAFLRDLKANNRRSWLKANDGEFRRAQKDWLSYAETLGARLTADIDETIPELPSKDFVFRVYRDTRFGKDPTPYKPHFAAAWSRTGKKGPYAHYYVQCEPGGRSFVGGGLWHPDAEQLRSVRTSIDTRRRRWDVLQDPGLAVFLGDTDPVAAFCKINAATALKTKPLGYAADHADIALLKLRNFTITKRVPDGVFTASDSQDQVARLFTALVPFVTHLNRILRPDPGEESEDEGDEN